MRRAADIEIVLKPKPEGISLQHWLYNEIRTAILEGRLAPGARLPASRNLALQHNLSRGTVLTVFDQLTAEGYIVGAVGSGSFVAPELPDRRPVQAKAAPMTGLTDACKLSRQEVPDTVLSVRGKILARSPFPIRGSSLPARAFRANQPDLTQFPFNIWARISARQSRLSHRNLIANGDAQGFKPLREAIARHLRAARGIAATADNVLIAGSVQQVLDLSARLLLDPGDSAWIEDPGYPGAWMVLEAAGAKVVGVPVDSGGIDVAAGRANAPNARLAYVTAGRQAPLGMPLALDRQLAILAWAEQAGAFVIEDDYDSEYRFTGNPLAAMKSLDVSGRVIYTGTFSKLLFPTLRLAYAVLPDQLIEPFTAALSLTSRHAPLATQMVLQEFIDQGHFGRHIRRMRLLYAERAKTLKQAFDTHLSGLLDMPEITTGLDAPAFFLGEFNDVLACDLAAKAGIETRPLSYYAVERPAPSGLVLGFAAVKSADIEFGAVTLAQVLESYKGRISH
jgi:GntR family transcriptional regulator/MocR family aminotransferase